MSEIKEECEACERTFSSAGNLKRHLQSSTVCSEWIARTKEACFTREFPRVYNIIQDNRITTNDILTKLDLKPKKNRDCSYCGKKFQTSDALSKHMRNSVICDKWRAQKILGTLEEIKVADSIDVLKKENDEENDSSEFRPVVTVSDIHEKFESPKYSLLHIIWNVFLTDKEFVKKHDFKTICEENNVKFILAIVPNQKSYDETIQFPICHSLMIYQDHDTTLDVPRFDQECKEIEKHRAKRDNIMVFCNSGYQRSLPFLCYYLYKHHRNEIGTIERAMDIILPQVDKAAYPNVRDKYIKSISELFVKNKL